MKLGAVVLAGALLMPDEADGTLITRTGSEVIAAVSPRQRG